MLKRLLVLVLMAACSDSDPHEITRCDDTVIVDRCEAACVGSPEQSGPACGDRCGSTLTYDGVNGCCDFAETPEGGTVVFIECP